MKKLSKGMKKFIISVLISITVIAAIFFANQEFNKQPITPQLKKETVLEIWTNLDRRVSFVDPETGQPVLTISADLAKEVMIAQLKLYKLEELEAVTGRDIFIK